MLVRKLRSLFGKAGDGDAGAATAAGGRAQASEQQAEAAPTLVLLDNAEALGTRFDQHLERFWEFRKGTVFAQGLRDKADTFLQANTPHPAETVEREVRQRLRRGWVRRRPLACHSPVHSRPVCHAAALCPGRQLLRCARSP